MARLFEENRINVMVMKNRLVRSATWEGMCDPEGRPTDRLIKCYSDLAAGGVGLIISGYAYVRQDGKGLPGQMGFHSPSLASDMTRLISAVHENGGKLCLQLAHAGGQTSSKITGSRPLAPSSVASPQYTEPPGELSADDIKELISLFAEGAKNAKAVGFDAVQLHAAHGYLVNQFLSPLTNRRNDDYGGNPVKRRRFLMDVYHAVRLAVGRDFPVLVKLNAADNLDGALTLEEALDAARNLDQEGIDAIEVSSGTPSSGDRAPIRLGITTREQEAYNLHLARKVKESVACPVMVVGGIRSLEVAEEIVDKEEADYISMSRPFIREPALARRWREGNGGRATCISCNGCFKPGLKEGGIYCVIDKIEHESEGYSA